MSSGEQNNKETEYKKPTINERYDVDHTIHDIETYKELKRKRRTISHVLGIISGFILLILMIDTLFNLLPINPFFTTIILLSVLFLLLFFNDHILAPVTDLADEMDISRKSFSRYRFNKAIDKYNEGDYNEVLTILQNIRDDPISSTNFLTKYNRELEQYIWRVGRRENAAEYIEITFPSMAEAIIREQNAVETSEKVFDNLDIMFGPDGTEIGVPSTREIYLNRLSEFNYERVSLVILSGVATIGLYYLFVVNPIIGGGILTFGIFLFSLLKHLDWL